jgi:hypothetical protein
MTPLTQEQIRTIAPAVYATEPSPHVSDRYGFIPTYQVMERLMDTGLVVTSAQQDRHLRSPVRSPLTVRHRLTLADPAHMGAEWFPQIQLWNEHRGHGKMHLGTGIYRLVCTNGMTVGRADAAYTVRHTSNVDQIVEEALKVVLEAQERSRAAIEHWDEIELTAGQVDTFAQRAAAIRFGGKDRARQYAAEDIAFTRRAEDEGNTLWRVFNRVQENLTQHKLHGVNANGLPVRSGTVSGLVLDFKFNTGLWQLAEEFAAV